MREIWMDPSTSNPPLYRYLGCIIIRVLMALSVYFEIVDNKYIKIIAALAVLVFGLKYYFYPNIWKNYLRVVITYLIVLFVEDKTVRSILIIMDSLMGLQSRHIMELVS
jgi:hypothetical protein